MKTIIILSAILFSAITLAQVPTVPDSAKAAMANGDAAVQSANAKAGAATADVKGGMAKAALVNINTASQADLQKVPGLGPAKAAAIIAGRPYTSIQDLTRVKGIKEAVLTKIKPYITAN